MGELGDYLKRAGLIKKRSEIPYMANKEKFITRCAYFAMVEIARTQMFDWIDREDADELCINCVWHRDITPKGGTKIQFDCTNPFVKNKTIIYEQERIF